ncbi:RNA-binding S4 domain-containing protein [Solitalea sp. MAHUQ-68]|uniref:RNA-binding S4 domain-containing protein n=1 Tax=Solitalea agri TaxID=2953739 RepID=A0A9X2JE47_9SPHI|nr:RNA-binding S4 domain-containing protein [Solitalea agri]MCO4294354.1 RNA-binding S4 domain-containing protein [Solitalea agri]
MTSFKINSEYIELIKLLKACGVAENGGHAQAMVDAGDIRVNGEIEKRKRAKLKPGDKVETPQGSITIE